MRVKAEQATPARVVLDDETAGAGGTHVRILADGKAHEVEVAHPRVRELLATGVLVPVNAK